MNKNTVKIGFVSLGCSKNLIDTEVMLARLANAGYAITTDETEADVVIVNTCAFIESAKKESIENILDIAWLKEHNGLKAIIVTGCLAERYGEQIFTELPEVDAVIGVGSIDKIEEAVEAVLSDEKFYAHADKNEAPLGGERIVTTAEHTAYLKIAEGCDNKCTYCAIPGIRGKFRSRTIEDIVNEAKELEDIGVKELNIIAQDTTRYGLDIYGEYALAKLVRAITDATSIPWIRLLYCYPDKITDELIAEMQNSIRIFENLQKKCSE
jgi:ribosomal protein S12 methylthiotransferase